MSFYGPYQYSKMSEGASKFSVGLSQVLGFAASIAAAVWYLSARLGEIESRLTAVETFLRAKL